MLPLRPEAATGAQLRNPSEPASLHLVVQTALVVQATAVAVAVAILVAVAVAVAETRLVAVVVGVARVVVSEPATNGTVRQIALAGMGPQTCQRLQAVPRDLPHRLGYSPQGSVSPPWRSGSRAASWPSVVSLAIWCTAAVALFDPASQFNLLTSGSSPRDPASPEQYLSLGALPTDSTRRGATIVSGRR